MSDISLSYPGDAAPRNPVLEQQRRLAAELEADAATQLEPPAGPTPYEAVLYEVLVSIEWKGERHRISEALPHQQSIGSVRMLRTVLARLGVRLIPIERAPGDLTVEDFPVLIHDEARACLLIIGDGGYGLAHDLRTGARRTAMKLPDSGAVYLIRSGQAEAATAAAPASGHVRHLLSHMRGRVAGIMAYSAAINAVNLALSLYVLMVYDIVIASQSLDTLILLAAGAGGAFLLQRQLSRARSRAIAYLASRFDGVVAVQTLASVLNMPLTLTERAPIASQLTRFRQLEIGRELFAGPLASAMFDLPFTLMFIVALAVIGGTLALVPVGVAVVIAAVCAFTAPATASQVARVGASKLKSDTLLLELTDKLRAIRNGSAESIWLARYAESLAEYQHARFDHLQHALSLRAVTAGLAGLAGILTLGVGAVLVMNGAMSLGALVAAMMIVWRLLEPIQTVALNLPRLKQTLSTAKQIDDVAVVGNERRRETPLVLPRRLRGNILMAGAYLALGSQPEAQLRGVNLAVKAGEIVAITGPTGSGKSILLKLLLGLYPQYIGTVRLDGLDLRQLDPAEVRAAVGYASQQPSFFYGSVAANFRLAKPDATDEDILEALAAIGVTLPNPAFPEGLATRISGSGARAMSHGLLCRLSIARALIKKSPILLFDDMGTGLDQAGDAAFLAQLDALRGRSTVLLATARPSHMRAADRVVEMRGGMAVAEGTPDVMLPRIMAQLREAG